MAYICTVCGEAHNDIPAFAFISPNYYHNLSQEDKDRMATLSDDWCIIEHDTQTDRFIRAVLQLPIAGTEETFEYGVWVSLSEKSFTYYMDNFKQDIEGETFFGFLCNQIPGYPDTMLLKTNVVCGARGQRPYVFPQENQNDHAFVHDFINGISPEEADKRIHQLLS